MEKSELRSVRERITAIRDLPTLPVVASEIMALLEDENSSVMDVARVMYKDPVMTAKVLKLANSAFFGLRRHVESLNQALVVLGMNQIFNLVISISVVKTFDSMELGDDFDLDAFWEHSMGTGEISRVIATKLGFRFEGAEFTSGLLHDIGKVILDQYFHDDFMTALKRSHDEQISLYIAERDIWGVDHAELGAWLGEQWRLPVRIIDVIRDHHKTESDSNDPSLVAVVRLANTFAKISEIGFSGDRVVFNVQDDPAWDILAREVPAIRDMDLARLMFELEEDIERAREFMNIVRP